MTHLLDHVMIVPPSRLPSAHVLESIRFGGTADFVGCAGCGGACRAGFGAGPRNGPCRDGGGFGAFGLDLAEAEALAARLRDDVAATWHAAEDAVQAAVWTPIERTAAHLSYLHAQLVTLAGRANQNGMTRLGDSILALADRVSRALARTAQGVGAMAEALWEAGPGDELYELGVFLLIGLFVAGLYVLGTPGGQSLLKSYGVAVEQVPRAATKLGVEYVRAIPATVEAVDVAGTTKALSGPLMLTGV